MAGIPDKYMDLLQKKAFATWRRSAPTVVPR